MANRLTSLVERAASSTLLFVVIGLVVGGAMAPVAMGYFGGPDGTIAVVPVDGSIDGEQAARYQSMMSEARDRADAVVLIANSGGGSAASSEEMYLQTKRTAEEMPVVTSVDGAAASGAYYTIVPSDYIYVKPSSIIGSVGVVAIVPPEVEPNTVIGTTGPDKLTGGSGRSFFYQLETIQQGFLNAVFAQRGDRLTVSRSRIAHASTFVGVRGVQLGLADAVGDRQLAIRKAAELAGLEHPRVVVFGPDGVQRTFLLRSTYLASAADDKELTGAEPFTEPSPGPPTFLMMPPTVLEERSEGTVTQSGDDRVDNGSTDRLRSGGRGDA